MTASIFRSLSGRLESVLMVLAGAAGRKRRRLVRQMRRRALRKEADPLFFKAARGEIDQDQWLDKVQEIRDRIPHFTAEEAKSCQKFQ